MFRALAQYGSGEDGCQYSHDVSPERTLPQNGPAVPPELLVGPDDTIVQRYAPMGIRVPAPLSPVTINVTPARHGLLYIGGVKSLTSPGTVEILRVTAGGGDVARNVTPFDASAYATTKCFCPVDWGCANQLILTFRGLTPGAQLNWVLFGTYQQSWNSCYPSLGTVEEHAAAVWGLAHGRDPFDHGNLDGWRADQGPSIETRELVIPLMRALRLLNPATKRIAKRLRAHLSAT